MFDNAESGLTRMGDKPSFTHSIIAPMGLDNKHNVRINYPDEVILGGNKYRIQVRDHGYGSDFLGKPSNSPLRLEITDINVETGNSSKRATLINNFPVPVKGGVVSLNISELYTAARNQIEHPWKKEGNSGTKLIESLNQQFQEVQGLLNKDRNKKPQSKIWPPIAADVAERFKTELEGLTPEQQTIALMIRLADEAIINVATVTHLGFNESGYQLLRGISTKAGMDLSTNVGLIITLAANFPPAVIGAFFGDRVASYFIDKKLKERIKTIKNQIYKNVTTNGPIFKFIPTE